MKIEIEGTYHEIVAEMVAFVEGAGFTLIHSTQEQYQDVASVPVVPEPAPVPPKQSKTSKPKTKKAKASEKETPPDTPASDDNAVPADASADGADTETEESPTAPADEDIPAAAAKQMAIDILMELYNNGKAAEVKKLLAGYDVKKFGEVPEARGPALLEDARVIEAA